MILTPTEACRDLRRSPALRRALRSHRYDPDVVDGLGAERIRETLECTSIGRDVSLGAGVSIGSGAGGGSSFPSVGSTSQGSGGSDTSHTITLPSGSGGKLLLFVAADGVPTITATGWTKVGQLNQSQNEGALAVFERTATGSDPTTVETDASEATSWICYRLSDAGSVEAEFAGGNAETDYNPPPLTPGDGSKKRLWFVALALDNSTSPSVTGTPTGYGDQLTETGGGAGMLLTALRRELEAETENPDSFSHDFETGVVATVAVDPA